jgi:hypothetical protein
MAHLSERRGKSGPDRSPDAKNAIAGRVRDDGRHPLAATGQDRDLVAAGGEPGRNPVGSPVELTRGRQDEDGPLRDWGRR